MIQSVPHQLSNVVKASRTRSNVSSLLLAVDVTAAKMSNRVHFLFSEGQYSLLRLLSVANSLNLYSLHKQT